jgi:hypothetical protein
MAARIVCQSKRFFLTGHNFSQRDFRSQKTGKTSGDYIGIKLPGDGKYPLKKYCGILPCCE